MSALDALEDGFREMKRDLLRGHVEDARNLLADIAISRSTGRIRGFHTDAHLEAACGFLKLAAESLRAAEVAEAKFEANFATFVAERAAK
jgi:hypothetical protein